MPGSGGEELPSPREEFRPEAVSSTASLAATVDPDAPGTAPDAVVAAAAQANTPATLAPMAKPIWPCSGCGASVDVALDACPACGTGFLGALRTSSNRIELPVVGDLSRFSDRGRVVIGTAGGLMIALVMVVLTALLGR
jgi:hypothetical protein